MLVLTDHNPGDPPDRVSPRPNRVERSYRTCHEQNGLIDGFERFFFAAFVPSSLRSIHSGVSIIFNPFFIHQPPRAVTLRGSGAGSTHVPAVNYPLNPLKRTRDESAGSDCREGELLASVHICSVEINQLNRF